MTGLAPFDPVVRGPDPTAHHVEPTPRRIRVRLGSRLVAESSRERVDLVLDGIPQPRTVSPWSNGTADVIENAADR